MLIHYIYDFFIPLQEEIELRQLIYGRYMSNHILILSTCVVTRYIRGNLTFSRWYNKRTLDFVYNRSLMVRSTESVTNRAAYIYTHTNVQYIVTIYSRSTHLSIITAPISFCSIAAAAKSVNLGGFQL